MKILIHESYVSRIYFRESNAFGCESNIFMMTRGGNGPAVRQLPLESPEHLRARALGLSGSSRSGDLLVESRFPYYFAPWKSIYYGQHGRGERVEDHVTLLILNPPGERLLTVRSLVEIIDIKAPPLQEF